MACESRAPFLRRATRLDFEKDLSNAGRNFFRGLSISPFRGIIAATYGPRG
jgi:hypothetical protein